MIARRMMALAISGLVIGSVAQAGPIFSGPATITNTSGTMVFDLLAGGSISSMSQLPASASEFNIQVISVVWSFDPPPGASGSLDIGAQLALAGMDSGLSFAETIDLADQTGNVVFTSNDAGAAGLPYQYDLAQHLLSNGGKIYGSIVPDPGTEAAWDEFFNLGGKLTTYMFVELTDRPNDTSQAPEPGAILVWGGVGALGLLAHRWNRRRKASKV